MLEWIIITIFGLVIAALIIFIIRLVDKVTKRDELYESTINNITKQIDSRDEYIAKFAATLYDVERRIREIDKKGMFISDDEVGFVYKAINQEIQRLYDFAKKEEQYGKEEKE